MRRARWFLMRASAPTRRVHFLCAPKENEPKERAPRRLGPCGTSLRFSPPSGEPDEPSLARRARAGIRPGTLRANPPSATMLGCVERVNINKMIILIYTSFLVYLKGTFMVPTSC